MFRVSGILLDGKPFGPFPLDQDQVKLYLGGNIGNLKFSSPSLSVRPTSGSTCKFLKIMEKKKCESIMPMPEFLVNNPNISIIPSTATIPSTPPVNYHPISINRVTLTTTKPTSAGLVVPVIDPDEAELTKKSTDSNETKNNKRVASSQLENRQPKKPRISSPKSAKVCRENSVDPKLSEQIYKLNNIQFNQIKKNDATSKSIPSSSGSANRVQDSICQQPPVNSSDVNCKVDSTNIDAEKMLNGTLNKYKFLVDGQLKINSIGSDDDLSNSQNQSIEIRTRNMENDEVYEIFTPNIMNEILVAVKKIMKKNVSKDQYESIVKRNNVSRVCPEQSPEHNNRSPETKNISPNSKLQPANHNNIISPTSNLNSKHQSTSKVNSGTKSPRTCNVQLLQSSSKPATTAAIQVSTSAKQTTSSTNLSPKTIKQNDTKHHVSSSNQCNTSLKQNPLNTVTQIQQTNKNQQPAVSTKVAVTHIPTVSTKKVAASMQCGKPSTSSGQSLSQDLKKCNKCNTLSDIDVCTACLIDSQYKGVTVTRIETPPAAVPEVIEIESDIDEEEETCPILIEEPIITRVETKDQLRKHIEKLSSNPKLLEDKLWQKDLSTKDFFKLDQFYTVQIGSFSTSPVPSGDMIICTHGIRMTVKNPDFEAVTIDIPKENIVKMYGNYRSDTPKLLIYTNYLAAYGIQFLLKMNEKNKNYYYDPLSKGKDQKKIMWSFYIREEDVILLERVLLKFDGKYVALTQDQINSIITKKSMDMESVSENHQLNVNTLSLREEIDSGTVMFADSLGKDRNLTMRISDYKMLTVDEYLNDILIEFFMNRWYMRLLSPIDRNRSYAFNSFFYSKLTRKDEKKKTNESSTESKSKIRHNRVRTWTKRVNIFEKDFLFFPINENFHWFMMVVCYPYLTEALHMDDGTPGVEPIDTVYYENRPFYHPPPETMKSDVDEADGYKENLQHIDPYHHPEANADDYDNYMEYLKLRNLRPIKQACILVFDSLIGSNGQVCRAKNVATLREYLIEEYRVKYNGAERDFSPDAFKGHTVRAPQQTNYTDCGLFVLHFCDQFFKKPILDYRLPISHLQHWFHPDDVQKNCKKRREVDRMILSVCDELNPRIRPFLPQIRYISLKGAPPAAPAPPAPPQQDNHNAIEALYNNVNENEMENSDDGIEGSYEEQDDEEEEYVESEEYDIPIQYRHSDEYSGNESYEEEEDYHEEMEYPEAHDEWAHPDDNYHVENEYGDDIDEFDNMNPEHVNVDDSHNGSASRRYQHISDANFGFYRPNNLTHRNLDEDDEDYPNDEADYDDEDDEPHLSSSYSNRSKRH